MGLAEIQSTLLARVTVAPKDLNAYYHLGGLSLILLKKDVNDWSASFRPLLENVARYATDIDASNIKTRQLNEMNAQANHLK